MPAKIKTKAILIKKQPYSETSILIQVFSESFGMISVLAKGITRSKKLESSLLNVLNEYELVISDSAAKNIHTLLDITLCDEYPTDIPLETWITAQAGLEIITKIIIPVDENPAFYRSMIQYLTYIKEVKENSIAIFWRFLIRIYMLLGVPIELDKCSVCHKEKIKPVGFSAASGQIICPECMISENSAFYLSPEMAYVFSILPVIGNYLQDLVLSRETINRLNSFFLNYLSLQFHKNIKLKSLQYFEENLQV